MLKLRYWFLLMCSGIFWSISAPAPSTLNWPEIKLDAPSAAQRISMAVAVGPSGEVKETPIFVKVRLAPGHHIYAMKRTGSQNKPTEIEAKLPAGVRLAGAWQGPEPKKLSDGSWVYEKEVLFTNVLNGVSKELSKEIEITVSFQVCNEALCWPPEKLTRKIVLADSKQGGVK